MEPAWKCQPINGHRFTWGPASHSGLNWFFTRSQRKKCSRPLWYNWHLGLKVKHWWWQIPPQRSQFSQPNSVRLWSSRRKKANVTKWCFFINSPSLTELALRPISNYGRVSIKKKTTIKKDCSHSFQLASFLCFTFHPNFTSTPHRCGKAPVSVCLLYALPFPRCVRAEVPSAGFLLSPLRGPQRLLIIPDLLALHPAPGPCSSLDPSLSLHVVSLALFAPLACSK